MHDGFSHSGEHAGGEHGTHGHNGHGHGGHGGHIGQHVALIHAPKDGLASQITEGHTFSHETARIALSMYGPHWAPFQHLEERYLAQHSMASLIALRVAGLNLGGLKPGGKLPWHRSVHLNHVPSFAPLARSYPHIAGGREVNQVGLGYDESATELVFYPHRKCDVKAEIGRIMYQMHMPWWWPFSGIEPIKPPTISSPKCLPETVRDYIMPHSPFDPNASDTNMPNLWFNGCKGKTRYWRELYKVPHLLQKCKFSVFLVVFGCTYEYEGGLCETRVSFSVYHLPKTINCHTVYDWKGIAEHREAGQKCAQQLLAFLQGEKAATSAIRERAAICPARTEPVVVIQPPVPREDLRDFRDVPSPTAPAAGAASQPQDDEV